MTALAPYWPTHLTAHLLLLWKIAIAFYRRDRDLLVEGVDYVGKCVYQMLRNEMIDFVLLR